MGCDVCLYLQQTYPSFGGFCEALQEREREGEQVSTLPRSLKCCLGLGRQVFAQGDLLHLPVVFQKSSLRITRYTKICFSMFLMGLFLNSDRDSPFGAAAGPNVEPHRCNHFLLHRFVGDNIRIALASDCCLEFLEGQTSSPVVRDSCKLPVCLFQVLTTPPVIVMILWLDHHSVRCD